MKWMLFLSFVFLSQDLLAWGSRGHHTICTAATHLVKSESLNPFLKYRMHMLGHLCNIPDFHWKAMGSETSDLGNPTHYIDPEIIGLKVNEISSDLVSIMGKYTGTENQFKGKNKIFSIPKEMGTLWWRADQFYRLIINLKTVYPDAIVPKNTKDEQDEKLPYNQFVYNMLVYMGIMGHFVGDASQPFHSTADFDGYNAGHGGIHSYYEEQILTHFGADFEKLIVDKAKTSKDKKLVSGSPIQIMQHLSFLSSKDIDAILKVDPVTKKSDVKNEKGMDIRTPAIRKSTDVGFALLKDLVVTHMARSAIALAHLWEEAYHEAGSISLQSYKSFRYPNTPEFIPPDYFGKIEPKKN